MRKRTTLLIVMIIVLALLAVGGTMSLMALTHSGFMGNNSNSNSNGMMGGYQQSPAMGVTCMNMQNSAYQYTSIQVRVGTTVTWTNQDDVQNSVTFKNGMKDSGLLSQGQSFSYTFNTPGNYQYYCSRWPGMIATVTVVS